MYTQLWTPPAADVCPHALMVPEASSAAKASEVDAMETKPLPVGASTCTPHELMLPEALMAAKISKVDAMETKPLPVGAPLPPE